MLFLGGVLALAPSIVLSTTSRIAGTTPNMIFNVTHTFELHNAISFFIMDIIS